MSQTDDVHFQSLFKTRFGQKIQREGVLLEFEPNQAIVRQGEPANGLYLVSSGTLGGFYRPMQGRRRFILPIWHGMCLPPYPDPVIPSALSIISVSRSYLYHLTQIRFDRLIATDREFSQQVGEAVTRTLNFYALVLGTTSIQPARMRVLETFRLANAFQPHLGPDAGVPLEKRFKQEHLAEMLGVSRPYLNRILSEIPR